MTPAQIREFRQHASALLLAAKTPEHARAVTKSAAVLDLLGKHFGYRIMLSINSHGANLHVTDDEGHEYSATSTLSAVDCLLDMAGTALEGHLTSRAERIALDADATNYLDDPDEDEDGPDNYGFTNDHNEGNTL